jgi:cytidylate kinase
MVKQQQAYAKERGVVMDGRDIGTVVFPDAELKIFLVASAEIRAQRRYDELIAKGEKVSFDEILENVKQRDFLDQTRKESPLRKAEDAIELDNGNLTLEEQRDWLLKRFKEVVE